MYEVRYSGQISHFPVVQILQNEFYHPLLLQTLVYSIIFEVAILGARNRKILPLRK